jgi:hypothetical protein
MTTLGPGLFALLANGLQQAPSSAPAVPIQVTIVATSTVGATTTAVVPSAAPAVFQVPASINTLDPIFAIIVALVALAGVIYAALVQRKTGKDTVREARKAADAALASAAASGKAATSSAAAVKEARRAGAQLEVWRQREETMRMVRWGLQQVASMNPKAATIGQNTLNALQKGTLVQPADSAFVEAVTQFVTQLVGDVVDTEVQNALSGYDPEDEFELNDGIMD